MLEECYFESGKCDWTSLHANSEWKLFPGTKSIKYFSKLKKRRAVLRATVKFFFLNDLLFLLTKKNP